LEYCGDHCGDHCGGNFRVGGQPSLAILLYLLYCNKIWLGYGVKYIDLKY